jgi:hypothetical protein
MRGAETSDYIVVPSHYLKHRIDQEPTWQEGLLAHYYDISGPIGEIAVGPDPYSFKIGEMDWATVERYWSRPVAQVNYNDRMSNPVGAWKNNSQAIKFVGQVDIPVTGDWSFWVTSDDGSLLYIDDDLVIDHDGYHGATGMEGTINLSAGWHDIKLVYFDGIDESRIELSYAGPGIVGYPVIPRNAFRHLNQPYNFIY